MSAYWPLYLDARMPEAGFIPIPGPSIDGYSDEQQDVLIRSNMDSGPGKVRKRFTSSSLYIQAKWVLTFEQLQVLKNFFHWTINQGADEFWWPNPWVRPQITSIAPSAIKYGEIISGNRVRVWLPSTHTLALADVVGIHGCLPDAYNGVFSVAAVGTNPSNYIEYFANSAPAQSTTQSGWATDVTANYYNKYNFHKARYRKFGSAKPIGSTMAPTTWQGYASFHSLWELNSELEIIP